MRLLVCGGRGYGVMPDWYPPDQAVEVHARAARESFFLRETLDCLHAEDPVSVVIHGGARGADALAGLWAVRKGIEVLVFKADWRGLGKSAGPIRNARMIFEGVPAKVVAFPGGAGTADMVRQARAAGVRVFEAGKG